ncbi:acetyl-CoA carboxylase biotin carboxylase subunit family protein [Streptomyces sp. NPDC051546]|uniref:acetyl-CoA carboxylase biotin carboxylase subunit family protein n=1 Tax=Streptomyces sp. NPDC051546 TaxID=3365655 RepID=UPI00379855D4
MNTHAPYQGDGPTGHLVVLGSGPQAEWEHAIQRLATTGPLLLIDAEPPTWQHPHLTDARTANPLDPSQTLAAVEKFANTRPIAGVLTLHPAHTRTAALLRSELALPGPNPAAVEATLLRHRTAQLLTAAGVDNSGALHADTYDQALEAAHQVGFPLVCKPSSPRAQHAARQVKGLSQLADAFSAAAAATWPGTGTVVEPLLDGIEATAYTTTGPRVVAISHATFDPQAEPSLIPVEVVVDADDVCGPAIEDTASRALAALGHRSGPAQIRMRITSTGPRIISIATHPTEPLLARLIEQVTGIDLITQAGLHARGRTIPTNEHESRLGATAVRYLQSPGTTPMLPPNASSHAQITPYATLQPYPAERLVGPLRRSGHLLVSGTDYPQCTARLRTAAAEIRIARLSA